MFRLDGQTALVTGAAAGIGAAIARVFHRAGATVILSDRDAAAGAAQAAALGAEFLPLDVTDETAALGAAAAVHARHGRLDILVNNAGIGHVGTLLQTTAADLDRLWRVNVAGLFHVTRAFLPHMLERRAGNILNLASIAGVVGLRDRLAYATTKFAVVGFTKSLALDHARDGLRCNCLCPGRVETEFVAGLLRQYPDPARARAELAATQALGRMGTPDEIAAAALYLASAESAFITGTAFIIDGGWSAGK
jgi:NAD(P)-dependent dehydrogenase (short-subunit alcohol dehydrogenase family)